MAGDVQANKFLVRLTRILASPVVILKRIGALVTSRSQRRFNEQTDAEGTAWPERWTPNIPGIIDDLQRGSSIKARRFEPRPVLLDTGRLRQSINWQLRSVNEVEIGTNVPYASTHQFGLERSIPVTDKVKTSLAAWLKTSVGNPWRPSLSWLLNKDQIDFTVLRREFIGIGDEDAFYIRQIVVDGLVPPGPPTNVSVS